MTEDICVRENYDLIVSEDKKYLSVELVSKVLDKNQVRALAADLLFLADNMEDIDYQVEAIRSILGNPTKIKDVMKEVNKEHAKRMKELEPELEKIRSAGRLTAADYQIVINARG